MIKCLVHRKVLTTIACAVIVSIGLSACEPLRKKFTRKKKEGQEVQDFIPVLEPQDYPAPENNPKEMYAQHYALIKAWYRDLWTAIDDKNSDKMAQGSLKQIFNHIDQMKPLLKAQKSQGLDQLAGLLKYYNTSLDAPRPLRNYARIESDLRAFDRLLRGQFRYDKVKEDIIR